jgi:hypothetical protein
MRCGAQCLEDVLSTVRGKVVPGGAIVGLPTHGRNGQDQPPRHLLATSGGWARAGQR